MSQKRLLCKKQNLARKEQSEGIPMVAPRASAGTFKSTDAMAVCQFLRRGECTTNERETGRPLLST